MLNALQRRAIVGYRRRTRLGDGLFCTICVMVECRPRAPGLSSPAYAHIPYPPLPCPTPRRSNLVGGRPALSLVVVPGSPDFSPGPGCLGHLLLVVRLVGYPFVGCRLSATRIKTPQVFSRRKPCQAPLHPHAHSQPAMVTNKAARGRIGRSRRYPSASAHNPSPLDRPLPIVV
jgi:hypothetical protein